MKTLQTAEDARKLTKMNVRGLLQTESALRFILNKIRLTALNGKNEISKPFDTGGFRQIAFDLTQKQKQSVLRELEKKGFEIKLNEVNEADLLNISIHW